MSIRSLINFAEVENTAIGVNFEYNRTSGSEISFCVLKKEKGKLLVLRQGKGIKTIDALMLELAGFLAREVRIHLNFEGEGIITKESYDSNTDPLTLFPGIQKADFVSQRYANASKSFASIVRKDLVEENEFYKTCREKVVSVTLSFFIIESILRFLAEETKIVLKNYLVHVLNESIVEFEPHDGTADLTVFQLGDDQVSDDVIVAYSAAATIIIPNTRLEFLGLNITDAQRIFQIKKRTYTYARRTLFGLLIVLFVNMVVFFSLSKEVQQLEERISVHEEVFSADLKSGSQARQIANLYSNLGWKVNYYPLLIADQIAASLPENIELQRLEIGVLNDNLLQREKYYFFESGVIRLQGIADSPLNVATWLDSLSNLSWVEKIVHHGYEHDSKSGRAMFEFELHIK